MVLRKSTLLRWRKIITDGPQEPENDYRREVFQALLENNHLSRKDLISMFRESEYVIDKTLAYLKKSHLIVYQNHGKTVGGMFTLIMPKNVLQKGRDDNVS